MADFVFHDPTGRRAKRANLSVGLMISAAALVVAAFFATLAFAPHLPSLAMRDPRVLQALHVETAHRFRRPIEWRAIPKPSKVAAGGAPRPLSVGFYVTWDESSRVSLRRHVDQLDVVSPQWVMLDGSLGRVSVTADPLAEAIIASSKSSPSVLPMVHNGHDALADQALASNLLDNPAAQKALVANLVTLAKQRGWAGYVFDLENLTRPALARYPALLAQARAALKPLGREVWVAVPFGDDAWNLRRFAAVSDSVVLMAYDQHWGGGEPGPVTAEDWFERTLAADMRQLDPAHTIVALGAHGYDWTLADKQGPGSAHAIGFYDATQTAHDANAQVSLDEDSLNPTFEYKDDDGRKHVVWFEDVATFFNQMKVADAYRPQGYALWRMGAEDPSVWTYLHQPYGAERAIGLEEIKPSVGVDFDGTGEILHVDASPTPGRRAIETDAQTGLISDETYQVMPTSYVIDRYGAHPGWVALTFDDGPDGRWTPKILDILEAKHANATFFVIGQNMQAKPGLVQREVRDGDMVGNHTWTHPNIAVTPLAQTDLEINTTQRLFQVLTGRSMRLFRPPYFGDAEPSTPGEVEPLLVAQRLGYLIAGLRIDPDDWKKPDPDLIVSRTLSRLKDTGEYAGQVVLLHDAGGDRSRTVQALPRLIDELKAQGYKLVTVDQLAGMSREDAMPKTSRSSLSLFLDRIGFGFFRYVNDGLQGLFIVAIVLGLARLLFLAILALVHRMREPSREPPLLAPQTGPLISVLIPCFNEEKVIAESVRRILASDWTNLEILVLDDGSRDRTAEVVRGAFAGEPRVELMAFENGGKARALNRGLARTRGDIIVALDADTLFPPDTLGRLARWFVDERVGAVAGNAIVGNRLNLITRWQALEYVTAQNLERRALAALGAVTVVPGAVGAWRRSVLLALGGYPADTLAEDQDLTLAVQRAGWRVEFDSSARAYTEAPDTVSGLLKQRFRWSFGTLQCIWKHRAALFNPKRPVLGFVALPQIWLFQIFLTVAAPLVDLAIVSSLAWAIYGRAFHPVEWSPDDFIRSVFYWAAFIFLDLSAGALGMALERRAPWQDLVWLPVQRFGYRQLMYYVVVKSVLSAVRGYRVGWGKLERRATAVVGRGA
jgi:cellulose synthase/poly-beta-1,6-N-acetylglucosamine synthase-like glycosyltransferase/spore germination protein YaaH/peptidoglycan/xylan/chitin deacetylase (PgdA/CDA1 family)